VEGGTLWSDGRDGKALRCDAGERHQQLKPAPARPVCVTPGLAKERPSRKAYHVQGLVSTLCAHAMYNVP
jgi:hypothetical protein